MPIDNILAYKSLHIFEIIRVLSKQCEKIRERLPVPWLYFLLDCVDDVLYHLFLIPMLRSYHIVSSI